MAMEVVGKVPLPIARGRAVLRKQRNPLGENWVPDIPTSMMCKLALESTPIGGLIKNKKRKAEYSESFLYVCVRAGLMRVTNFATYIS